MMRVARGTIANDLAQNRGTARKSVAAFLQNERCPPSPATNPSRVASKGRDACSGSSLRMDSAFIAAKPARQIGVIAASDPPATITSARPARMSSKPSPMADADAAQAVTVHELGPIAPSCIAISPAAIFGIIIGHMYGLTFSAPLSCRTWNCASRLPMPPIPVPHRTPTRKGASATSIPDWVMASVTATSASWVKRSRCFAR